MASVPRVFLPSLTILSKSDTASPNAPNTKVIQPLDPLDDAQSLLAAARQCQEGIERMHSALDALPKGKGVWSQIEVAEELFFSLNRLYSQRKHLLATDSSEAMKAIFGNLTFRPLYFCSVVDESGYGYFKKEWRSGADAEITFVYGPKSLPVKGLSSDEIDWDRFPLPPFSGTPPILEFEPWIFEQEDVGAFLLPKVYNFFLEWKRFFDDALPHPYVFEKTCSRLMMRSLRFKKLDVDFAKQIKLPQYQPKDFEAVKRCIVDMLHLDDLRGDVQRALMASKPNEGESMRDFCDRVEGLLAAAGDETFEQMLIRSLYNRLPQNGREMVLRRFKSLKDISDPADLLDFFVVHPGIFEGPKVDNALWHRDRLGASKSVPHSSAPAGNGRRANKNKGKRRRAASRRAMAAPYPTGGGGGGSTSPSTAPCPPVPGTICQEQVCRILGKRWHDASLCFKYTRKNVWRRMEATANEVLRHAQEPSPSLYSPEPSPVPYSPEYSPRPYSPVHSPRQYSPERSPSPYSPEPFADSTSYTSADELDQRHKWESPLPPKRGKRHNYRGGRGRRGR